LRENAVHFSCVVNGEPAEALVDPAKTLLEVLREDLHLTGTKHGCELGECGACAVLVNGRPVLSCLALAVESNGADITTIEGIGEHGQLHPLQDAFADWGGSQCGYCTPGIILTAKALLDRQPDATRDDIKEALSGNLCRCTGYLQIFEAVEAAQAEIRRRGHSADDARGPEGPRLQTTPVRSPGPLGPGGRPLGPRESK
jgi:carbon-monoxide dehydrogenase small subunit